MRVRKIILSLFVMLLTLILGLGQNIALATETTNKSLYLSYGRYVYDSSEFIQKGAYAVNNGNNHCIFQIRDTNSSNANNFYCLDATTSYTWNYQTNADTGLETGNVATPVVYDRAYDMISDSEDIKQLISKYSAINNSNYLGQILWILDNSYVSAEDNDEERIALLARAGIKKTKVYYCNDPYEDMRSQEVYSYVPAAYEEYVNYLENESNGIKYKDENNNDRYHRTQFNQARMNYEIIYPNWIAKDGTYGYSDYGKGYFITDNDNTIINCDLPAEIVEAVQQAAIWYYTNYKITGEDYNFYTGSEAENMNNWLKYSVKTDSDREYKIMSSFVYNPDTKKLEYSNVSGGDYEVGKMYQEQACILYDYLIDSANAANPGDNNAYASESSKSPLEVNSTAGMKVNGTNYVVGPITISKEGELPYILNNLVVKDQNDNEISDAYISDEEGNELVISDYASLVDNEFYITVPSNGVSGVTITFSGTYQATTKTIWIKDGVTDSTAEQIIVEIIEDTKPLELVTTASINKEFDLALRKAIIALKNSNGTIKAIVNEDGSIATRNINYVAKDIASNKTATYKHRKDPIVVSNGDVVTYSITIYNEGDKNGYATKIVDRLPSGLVWNDYAKEGAVKKVISKNGVEYEYVYNPTDNTITFNNISKNILNAYDGSTNLASETIEVDCKVVQTTATSNYTYLTNIAYIAEEYNSEDNVTIFDQDGADRDSKPSVYPTDGLNTTGTSKNSYSGYKGSTSNSVYNGNNGEFYYAGQEDDDDFEIVVIRPVQFDLKLVKYIDEVNGEDSGREITVDSSKLKSNQKTTADYDVSKVPVKVNTGDYVKYTIRVYNEAEIDGYAEEITEDIPKGLKYIWDEGITIDATGKVDYSNCTQKLTEADKKAIEFNLVNCWTIKEIDSTTKEIKTVKSDFLSESKSTSNKIKAFDSEIDNGMGSGLSYKEVSIMLKVVANDPSIGIIRNEAEISEDSGDDRDSDPNQWEKKNDNDYYEEDPNYPKYEEDDEDYDNIVLAEFDLALRKFIAAVSKDINIEDGEYLTEDGTSDTAYTRAPKVNTTHLKDGTADTAIYEHSKAVVTVSRGDYVLYTIRVYNEGDTDGYAAQVTDNLPTYLDYVDCEFNDLLGWTVSGDAKTISTEYLSSEQGENNILKAFDAINDDNKGSGLSYKDIQILCKVNDNAIPLKNITNIAEITEYQNEDGNEVERDRDSESDSLTDEELNQDDRPEYEGGEDTDKTDGYVPGQEDDDDFERIVVREFDLALLKYVSEVHVIEDGNLTVTQTGNTGNKSTDVIPKVEIHRKKVNTTVVKFVYTIKITNEGDIPGYATEITDYVPQGLKFYEEDNEDWVDEGNNIISTKQLKGTLLNPGESATVKVTFRWINGNENLGVKTNYAEISQDYNQFDVPDRDSTPDNQVKEEDDMDYAEVLLTISTGLADNMMLYITLGGVSLVVLAVGIVMIKRYVL